MHPVVSYPLALLVAICLSSVETAPGNVAQLIVPLTLAEFQFPPEVKEEEIRQNPEPRLRNAEDVQGRFLGSHKNGGTTILVLSLPATSASNGTGPNVTQTVNTTVTPSSATTTTRVDDFIRTPIAVPYPVSFPMQSPAYPMQYFRKRQDQSPAVSYPSALFGWNGPDQALLGDGGFSSMASAGGGSYGAGLRSPVPMVPITIGNEVRYVPLNLRMFRQLIPNQPVIRESEDLAETDDLSPFSQEVEEVNDDEDNADASEGLGGLFRFRQRRRRPLQNLRRVQYL